MHTVAVPLFDPSAGQGARQFAELGLALLLSTLIGAERATQQKSVGLRTHTLVGVGSALFMVVSQHGFNAVLGLENVSFDSSRVAAQIVSGTERDCPPRSRVYAVRSPVASRSIRASQAASAASVSKSSGSSGPVWVRKSRAP